MKQGMNPPVTPKIVNLSADFDLQRTQVSYLPLGSLCALQCPSRARVEHRRRHHLFLSLVLPNGPLPQRQVDGHGTHQEHARLPGHLVGLPLRQQSRPRSHRWSPDFRGRFCPR